MGEILQSYLEGAYVTNTKRADEFIPWMQQQDVSRLLNINHPATSFKPDGCQLSGHFSGSPEPP
ncbi:hypothetical protein CS542_02330 [Pedobacter sp. IW39]|nr:hypothetical protein CS542_02330 [Pedobacter sp. IW39]